jgi:hypothetical protein
MFTFLQRKYYEGEGPKFFFWGRMDVMWVYLVEKNIPGVGNTARYFKDILEHKSVAMFNVRE